MKGSPIRRFVASHASSLSGLTATPFGKTMKTFLSVVRLLVTVKVEVRKLMKTIVLAFGLAIIAVGCATLNYVHQPFLPATADSATPVAFRVVLTQDDPFVAAKEIHAELPYAYGGGSLMDAVILHGMNALEEAGHEAANKHRRDKAAKMGAPLMRRGIDTSFRNDIQSSLSAALSSSPWLHTMPLEMTRENKQVMMAEVTQHPIVQIRLMYYLSYDASALIMHAHLDYFRQGQKNAAFGRWYIYYSEPVGPEREDAAVAKWVASDQELLHRRMCEGMSEVIAMLERDFFHPEPMDPNDPTVRISCYDAANLSRVQWRGHILRKGNPRILFQEMSLGNDYSIVPDSIQPVAR